MCIKLTSWRRRWCRGDTFPLNFINIVRERRKGRRRRKGLVGWLVTGEEKGKDKD